MLKSNTGCARRGKDVQGLADQSRRYGADDKDFEEYKGAYKMGLKVLALMRDNSTWKLAEIFKVRKSVYYEESDSSEDDQDEDSIPVMQQALNIKIPFSTIQEEVTKEANEDGAVVQNIGVPTIIEEEKQQEKIIAYEYYIHYMGIDRRNERWVTEHFIRVDDPEEIQRQEIELKNEEHDKKDNAYLKNDENHGWNEKEQVAFYNQFKIKSVESIQFGE